MALELLPNPAWRGLEQHSWLQACSYVARFDFLFLLFLLFLFYLLYLYLLFLFFFLLLFFFFFLFFSLPHSPPLLPRLCSWRSSWWTNIKEEEKEEEKGEGRDSMTLSSPSLASFSSFSCSKKEKELPPSLLAALQVRGRDTWNLPKTFNETKNETLTTTTTPLPKNQMEMWVLLTDNTIEIFNARTYRRTHSLRAAPPPSSPLSPSSSPSLSPPLLMPCGGMVAVPHQKGFFF